MPAKSPPKTVYFVERSLDGESLPYYGRSATRLFRGKQGIKDWTTNRAARYWRAENIQWVEVDENDRPITEVVQGLVAITEATI